MASLLKVSVSTYRDWEYSFWDHNTKTLYRRLGYYFEHRPQRLGLLF